MMTGSDCFPFIYSIALLIQIYIHKLSSLYILNISSNTMRSPSTFLLVSFLNLLLLSSASTPKILCAENEKQALLDFKQSFVDNIGVLSSWKIDNGDCCNWYGVGCANDTGHVTLLDLNGNDLQSYNLRPSLIQLQHLTSLSLNGNQFSMRIPKFIGSLSNLTSLTLSYSGFFGEIPPHLGNLSRLISIDLSESYGMYSHSLNWLSKLSLLKTIELSQVDLSNVIDWLSTIKTLPSLSAFYCDSCSLPQPLLSSFLHVNSTYFVALDLSNNSVSYTTFSLMINQSNNLRELSLNYMRLTNLHEFFGAITKEGGYSLEDLCIVGNNLTKLPFKVLQFPSLQWICVANNKISASLSEILEYLPINLSGLVISSNFLNGVVSDAQFSNFSKLYELDLSNNYLLYFNFSNNWVPPFQLDYLYLSSCKVGPNFPNWILTQKHISILDISNSMLYNGIPDDFWHNLNGLIFLNLSHNKIISEIPNLSLSLYNSVSYLDLSNNEFYGPIPFFLFTVSILDLSNNKFSSFSHFQSSLHFVSMIKLASDNLIILNLEDNSLSGTLPKEIGSFRQLNGLHLSNNNLSGTLPSTMRNCTRLTILELANNSFSGVVPSWIGTRLARLIVLTLRSNDFSGGMPSSLCHLQSLQVLDLSNNKLSGTIPRCIYNFSSMVENKEINFTYNEKYKFSYFFIDGNKIYTDFAVVMWKGSLANMYSLSLEQRNVINLSGNKFRGDIPIGVTALKELKSLDLSGNYLNGSIPNKIGQLTSLELLKLSSNNLCGKIPESLANLNFLGVLNLSNNDLSGKIPTGNQLQTFDATSYAGNLKLCGDPLPIKCLVDADDGKTQPLFSKDAHDESFDLQAFLAALGSGFAFGLLGVLGIPHFHRRSRLAFFKLIDNIVDIFVD